ncbi:MAG: CoA transferase subunit A [Candidatus Dormibacter sp.]|uniref:CoA transferase subunit A n=1 Tax=Candidatus Dormibacter sp. TaxID=2973982 RepID=UPI000DB4E501|nr:MAG: CoA transferase subunit A [Candidatus Dormibacteraeota bacterium]
MSQVMSLAQAVERFVPDGAAVAMGCCLEPAIPFAAGHEVIRQRRRDLKLIGPISDSLFDQLIGAGCVAEVVAAWVGNVSEGLGHCYRRAVESRDPRPLTVRDHSNFSISLALWAAAWNSPYIPTPTLLGSDILSGQAALELVDGSVRVGAVRPDVCVLHVQRADAGGRAHTWGPLGVAQEAALAADGVILTCEQLVEPEVILSDPSRVLVPETKVVAVVHEPGGCLPSPLPGYWKRDHAAFREYAALSRTAEGFGRWLREWVLDVPDRAAYLAKLELDPLRVTRRLLAEPADYGYE